MKYSADPGVTVIGIGAFIIIAIIAAIAKSRKEADRKKRIYAKYGETELANRLTRKMIWTGETTDQLRDSLGAPLAVDEKVLKTKRKEVWKYVRKGENRYGLRTTIESGVFVGWDEKS